MRLSDPRQKMGIVEQTQTKVDLVQNLMDHMKPMEYGIIGVVSSNIFGFSEQSKNKKGLQVWSKGVCRVASQTC
jgi:hypothetical protein